MSIDNDDTADIISLIGVSAALQLSGLPFSGPLSAARVGFIDGSYILNPGLKDLKESQLDMVVAGSTDAVFMDESEASELSEDQKDSDSLPEYDVLDKIIEMYVEQDESKATIIERGFSKDTVERVIRLIDFSEYKRRQAPLGVKITSRGFGKDRRYPITNKFLK